MGRCRADQRAKSTKGSSYPEVLFVVLKLDRERRDYCYVLKSNKEAMRGVDSLGIAEIEEECTKYMADNDELGTSPISSEDQKGHDPVPKKRIKERSGFWRFDKVTMEFAPDGELTKTTKEQRGKTLWDWLQLLIIPFALGLMTISFNMLQSLTSNRIVNDQQQETALETYLDRMSALMIDKHLKDPKIGAEAVTVAQARTITVLPRLDINRKGVVIQFLHDAGLITTEPYITPLIKLTYVDLNHIKLSLAKLDEVDLSNTSMESAELIGASLNKSWLFATKLNNSNLSYAELNYTKLVLARLEGANLIDAELKGADLSYVSLRKANLHGAKLYGANLRGATLDGVDLQEAEYNTKVMQEKNILGKLVTLDPTQWPQGFDPKTHGAICVDCKKP